MEHGSFPRRGTDPGPATAFLNAVLASSWPAAVPPGGRPQPPSAPARRPSSADWDVPAFTLPRPTPPAAHRRGLRHATWAGPARAPVGGHGPRALLHSGGDEDEEEEEDLEEEEEEEEECVFELEGGPDAGEPAAQEREDAGDLGLQYEMVGLDGDGEYIGVDLGLEGLELDQRVQASFRSAGGRGGTDGEGGPSLGASPTLLSAIDQLAARAEAGRSCG